MVDTGPTSVLDVDDVSFADATGRPLHLSKAFVSYISSAARGEFFPDDVTRTLLTHYPVHELHALDRRLSMIESFDGTLAEPDVDRDEVLDA